MDIYTSGDLAFLESIWTGLGHIWSTGFLRPVLASALMLNFLSGILRWIFDQKQPLFVNFWQSILIYLVFFSTTTTVNLIKDGEAPRAIAGDFPIGFVAPASWITTAGHSISSEFKDNITAVNVGYGWSSNNFILEEGVKPLELLVRMRNERVGLGGIQKSDLLSDSDDPSNANSGLDEAISLYFDKCVKKYLMLSELDNDPSHKKLRDKLASAVQGESFWNNILVDQASWPFTYRLDGSDVHSNCSDAHGEISSALIKRAKAYQRSKLLGGLHDSDSSQDLAEAVSAFNDAVAKLDPAGNGDAATRLQTNLWAATALFGTCQRDMQLGPQYVQSCHHQFTAIQNRRVTEASKFDSFKEMVGPLVTFVEGFVYMITPLLLIIIMFMGGAALKLVGKYFSALMWVILMPICQVAVDVYLNVYFNRWYYAVLNGDTAGTNMWSLASQESNWTQLESFIAFAGTAQAMVPALAMFIIFAGVHTLQGLGASASSGGSIGASTVAPDTTAVTKNGTSVYSNVSASQVRDVDGNYVGNSVATTKGLSNANDSNIQLGQNGGIAYQKILQDTTSQKIAASAQLDSKYQSAYEHKMENGERIDSTMAAKVGFSKNTAVEGVVNQAIADKYDLGKDGSRALSKILDYKVGVDGEVSASMSAGVGNKVMSELAPETSDKVKSALRGMGFNLKDDVVPEVRQGPNGEEKIIDDKSGKPKGNASAGAELKVGAGIKGGLGGHSTEAVNDTSRETVSISNSASESVQKGWKEVKQMLHDWNENHSYGDGQSDVEAAKDMLSVGGQTAVQYQEAVDRSEALAQRRTEMVSNTQSTGSAVASISKLDYAFGNALGNGSGFTGVNNDGKSGVEVMRDKALGYFAPDANGQPGVYDADNLTQKQADYLNQNISASEMKELKELGLNIGDEGFKAHEANFESDITTQARWAGMSEDDLYKLANYQPDATSPEAGVYEQRRQQAMGAIISKVDALGKDASVENAAEMTAASGAYFSRLGELNLGPNGDAGGGRFSNLSTYGDRLTSIAEEGIVPEAGTLTAPQVSTKLDSDDTFESGSNAVSKSVQTHLEQLNEIDGGGAEVLATKAGAVVDTVEQSQANAEAAKKEIRGYLDEAWDLENSAEALSNIAKINKVDDDRAAIAGQADATQKTRRDDLVADQNEIVRRLFGSELTQKELAMVQDNDVIENAQQAFKSFSALNEFESKYVTHNEVLRYHDTEFQGIIRDFDSSKPEQGIKSLTNFFADNGSSPEEASKLANEFAQLKTQFDNDYSSIQNSTAGKLDFMLIAGDRSLEDTTNSDDFRETLERLSSSKSTRDYGNWHL